MEINFNNIVDMVRRADTFAFTDQTGGGTATIFAGPKHFDPVYDGDRYTVIAGPGWFLDGTWQEGRGDVRDFSVGWDVEPGTSDFYVSFDDVTLYDDEGDVIDGVVETVERTIAEQIINMVKEATTPAPATPARYSEFGPWND